MEIIKNGVFQAPICFLRNVFLFCFCFVFISFLKVFLTEKVNLLALETEGIFRRSANILVIKELQRACNRGEPISFRNDPHNAAVLLKTFLRDLEEPLLTFDLHEEILKFQSKCGFTFVFVMFLCKVIKNIFSFLFFS